MSEGLEYETIVQNGPRKVSAFYFFLLHRWYGRVILSPLVMASVPKLYIYR